MKILWFVNTPFPEVVEKLRLKGDFMGNWMSSLKQALLKTPGFQSGGEDHLGIACALPSISEPFKFQTDKVTYFCIPKSRMCDYLQSYKRELSHCIHIVNIFNPDIVHVHGTEEFYGLITEKIENPVVISIQGVLSAYSKVYFGSMKWKDIIQSPRIIRNYFIMCRKTKTERRIFLINRNFIGRTIWDKSHLLGLAINQFTYYYCDEIMRKEFYEEDWSIEEAKPETIACISSSYPYKGIDSILDGITYLIKRLPDIRLNFFGSFPQSAYGAFLRKKVKKLGLTDRISFCGFKSSKELARELKKARAFIIASHIENSSNSLQEAMLVGTPSVVSFSGGLPSIAQDKKTCLMFPRGDAAVMADCLYNILTDGKLAVRISKASKIAARKRNDPEKITEELLEIYKDVIGQRGKKN